MCSNYFGGGVDNDAPTDSISIRPVTADDVVLMLGGESPSTTLEFSSNIVAPSFQALYIMTNKDLFMGQNQSHLLKPALIQQEGYAYTYQIGEFTTSQTDNVTLDLFVKD